MPLRDYLPGPGMAPQNDYPPRLSSQQVTQPSRPRLSEPAPIQGLPVYPHSLQLATSQPAVIQALPALTRTVPEVSMNGDPLRSIQQVADTSRVNKPTAVPLKVPHRAAAVDQVTIPRNASHKELLSLNVAQYVKIYQKAVLLQNQVDLYQKENVQNGDRITAIYNKLHPDQGNSIPPLICRLQPRPSPDYKFYELSEWTDFLDPNLPKLTHAALAHRMYFLLNPDGSHVLTPDFAKKDGAWSREARIIRKEVANNVKALCRVLRVEDPAVVVPENFADWREEWKERVYAMTYPLHGSLAMCKGHWKIQVVVESLELWKGWIKQYSNAPLKVEETEADVDVEETTEADTSSSRKRKNAEFTTARVPKRRKKQTATENDEPLKGT